MFEKPSKVLFITGLSLMLVYRLVSKLPFLPEEIWGIGSSKVLKLIAGLVFIILAFLAYKKPKNSSV